MKMMVVLALCGTAAVADARQPSYSGASLFVQRMALDDEDGDFDLTGGAFLLSQELGNVGFMFASAGRHSGGAPGLVNSTTESLQATLSQAIKALSKR